jgi:asparagine synthase (glutamine-hydrolysing)
LRDPRADRLWSLLTARDGLLAAYLDRQQVESLVERQKGGRYDVTDRLWRLLNLQLWGDLFLTGKREERWGGLLLPAGARAPV